MNRWAPASRVALVLLLLAVTASTADAQRRSRRRAIATQSGPMYGPHIGYNFDAEALVLGAQLTWPFTPDLAFYPTFDYYFVDSGSLWAFNFDLKYRPPTRYSVWYLGGGLNVSHASSGGTGNTDTNLDLNTGLQSRRGKTRPYVEARFIFSDNTTFQLVGGLNFR